MSQTNSRSAKVRMDHGWHDPARASPQTTRKGTKARRRKGKADEFLCAFAPLRLCDKATPGPRIGLRLVVAGKIFASLKEMERIVCIAVENLRAPVGAGESALVLN